MKSNANKHDMTYPECWDAASVLYINNNYPLCVLCASARKKQNKPSIRAGLPLIRKSTTTVRPDHDEYIFMITNA
jgi:hypothetical protein